MLWKILIGVAGVLVLFAAVAATRPSAYHVERKLAVAAPAERVFGVLNDLQQFAGVLVLFGSPWETQEPNMQKTLEGPAARAPGAGFSDKNSDRTGLPATMALLPK